MKVILLKIKGDPGSWLHPTTWVYEFRWKKNVTVVRSGPFRTKDGALKSVKRFVLEAAKIWREGLEIVEE